MTFKHTKFDDSATMRSLIKVAAEKGWVKSEPLKKTASASEDLSPSHNLTENVMKLCSGLRASGLDKYADEVEIKFLAYKQANSLYNVHNEEGKDLIDAAHPKGGHKMKDLAGDVLVETILENRLKILNVVNKKPTGKLASHFDIMNAVKVVLGEERLEDLESQIRKYIQAADSKAEKIRAIFNKDLTIPIVTFWGDADLENPTIDNIRLALKYFNRMVARAKPGVLVGASEDSWAIMQGAIESVRGYLDKAITLKEKANNIRGRYYSGDDINVTPTQAPAPLAKKPLEDLISQVNSVKNKVRSWKSIGPVVKQPTAVKWIDTELSNLEDILNRYNSAPEDQHVNLVSSLSKELNAELKDINQFEKDWITG